MRCLALVPHPSPRHAAPVPLKAASTETVMGAYMGEELAARRKQAGILYPMLPSYAKASIMGVSEAALADLAPDFVRSYFVDLASEWGYSCLSGAVSALKRLRKFFPGRESNFCFSVLEIDTFLTSIQQNGIAKALQRKKKASVF